MWDLDPPSRATRSRLLASHSVRLNPRAGWDQWSALAAAKYGLGRTEEAVQIWERNRAAVPDDTFARFQLVTHYERTDQHTRAQEVVEEILRINPDFRVGARIDAFTEAYPEEVARGDALLRQAGLP